MRILCVVCRWVRVVGFVGASVDMQLSGAPCGEEQEDDAIFSVHVGGQSASATINQASVHKVVWLRRLSGPRLGGSLCVLLSLGLCIAVSVRVSLAVCSLLQCTLILTPYAVVRLVSSLPPPNKYPLCAACPLADSLACPIATLDLRRVPLVVV